MMPRKVIKERKPSAPAICEHVLGTADIEGNPHPWLCAAPMRLEIKEPQVWSYQIRVSERCSCGHISHGQGVLDD